MKALVDSTAWSEMLRRKGAQGDKETVHELKKLIRVNGAKLIGAIRQEVLSGIRDPENFISIRDILRIYPEVVPNREDYELAAECYTACLTKGVSPTHVDMLICAVSIHHGLEILTLDKDFNHYAKAIPIRLYKV